MMSKQNRPAIRVGRGAEEKKKASEPGKGMGQGERAQEVGREWGRRREKKRERESERTLGWLSGFMEIGSV